MTDMDRQASITMLVVSVIVAANTTTFRSWDAHKTSPSLKKNHIGQMNEHAFTTSRLLYLPMGTWIDVV